MSKLNKLLFISILVSLLLTLLIVFLPNSINDYYATPEIYDTGFNYYMWKFRPINASGIARVTSWLFFLSHFIVIGVLMKKLKTEKPTKSGYNKVNIYLLLANLGFVLLHYIHTWVWYDALAQDTPVWSSQGSVIIMLVLILIMENRRRGLFFGKKIAFPKESTNWIMKNHGLYITLAVIFTFWYHPMEFTSGHLFGFFYMFLLFIQMSLARTKMHNNMYWKIVLEVTVLFHGTSVALSSANAPWAMFLFGFAAIFFITQIYGLNLKKRTILISQISALVITILIYSGLFTNYKIADINEVIRIPAIEYLLVFVFVYLIYLPIYLNKKFSIPKIVNKIAAGILIFVLSASALLVIFSSSPYQPLTELEYWYRLDGDVTETNTGSSIIFAPDDYSVNIVFVPGGKVVPESYNYIAAKLANEGYKVTIIKPLLNLAILQPNQANRYFEDDKVNVVMGHSLGGVVASMVASKNAEVDYLIMMGAYNTNEISNVKTLSIRAGYDIQLNMEKYEEQTAKITDFTEVLIQGGNHAYFGWYGEQKGDGTASISVLQQQNLVLAAIINFLP